MEVLSETIQTTLNSFDFGYCIIVNILTYLIIKNINEARRKDLTKWSKRLVLLIVIFSTGVLYYITGDNVTTVVNSAILAPVFWSWILKPFCAYFNIDYKDIKK